MINRKVCIVNKNIELLAPVGSKESLYAAINNGANAVYLGGKLFNARQFASNFDFKELEEIVGLAHFNEVKVYVTVNILMGDEEIDQVLDYIRFLYNIDVDAIIVQDLGLAHLIRSIFPEMKIHGSTQMTVHNLYGAKFLEDMGFKRIVLARETPLEEIKNIKNNTSIEIEGFIHGALCVSYSGQCLMSSLIGGRSGNRGTCAQPCRMIYDVVNMTDETLKSLNRSHILSTRDLNTLEYLDEIIESGVTSLKIEGRMKRPEYVATIVKNYRKALDKGKESITKEDKRDVRQIFNREFTKGIGLGDFGKTFISSERPDNRGILIGEVIKVEDNYLEIKLIEDLKQGDGIEFLTSTGKYVGEQSKVQGRKNETIRTDKLGDIVKGSFVYKTSSIDLLESADIDYKIDKKPVKMNINIKLDEFPKLILEYYDRKISVQGDYKVEKSKNISLDEDRIKEQLSKLGNTYYHLEEIKIDLEDDVFLPLGVLNTLRRDAVKELDSILLNFNNRSPISDMEYNNIKTQAMELKPLESKKERKISVGVSNREQFNQLDLNKLDRLYLKFYEDIEDILKVLKDKEVEIYIEIEKINYEDDFKKIGVALNKIKDHIHGVSVSDIGALKYIKDNFQLEIHCGIGLNIFNSHTIDYLNSLGINSMSLSSELNLKQIKDINNGIKGNLESIVYGYLPSMIIENCPLALIKGCTDDENCKNCNFKSGYGLKDRMDMIFPLVRENGYSILYNSLPVMVLDSLEEIYKAGVSFARVDFTVEKENIGEIQEYFYDYTKGNIDKKEIKALMEDFRKHTNITRGHYYRGVI